jgi:hypothetical protein
MKTIDPRKPGASSQSDDFCDPHGHGVGSPSMGGHVGMGRDDDGSFSNKSMSRGGESPDGDDMVAKYRPGRGGGRGGSSDKIPSGASLNDEGDGYDDSSVDDGYTVNENVVRRSR